MTFRELKEFIKKEYEENKKYYLDEAAVAPRWKELDNQDINFLARAYEHAGIIANLREDIVCMMIQPTAHTIW